MTQPQDAALLAALESQYRQLDEVLARLSLVRAACLAAPPTFWRGAARHAYDTALGGVTAAADAAGAALGEARDHLHWAAIEVRSRG